MTQKAEIQALINQINETLSKSSPRLPWVMSSDAAQQRHVLEQTRQYLLSLQQQLDEKGIVSTGAGSSTSASSMSAPSIPAPAESAQQVLQAVLQEMNYWRVNMLQPLRTEIDTLQQQRQMLIQDVRQLEAQRQKYGLPQQNQQMLMEFLQSAMAQMQASLSAQVSQQMAQIIAAQSSVQSGQAALSSAERLTQMQQMQSQSDQLMLKLDSTLQAIFDSLNHNVQAYQESLEQGLNRMHGLGQQGEAMFAFLVNRLAQQIGREASSFLQSQSSPDWRQQPELPRQPAQDPAFTVADFLSQPEPEPFSEPVPFNLSEEVLDIAELDSSMQQTESEVEQPSNSPADQVNQSDQLEALNQELNQLDLNAISTESERASSLDLFAGDQPLLPNSASPLATPAPPEAGSISDLDSALDLLNQLSAEMQAGATATDAPTLAAPNASPDLSDAVSDVNSAELISSPDALYDDAFYSSPPQEPNPVVPEASAPVNQFTLEQEWFGGLGDPAAQSQAMSAPEPALAEHPLVDSHVDSHTASSDDLFAGMDDAEANASLPDHLTSESLFASEQPDLSNLTPPTRLEEPLPVAEASAQPLDLGIEALDQLGIPASPTAESAKPSLTIEGLEGLFADLPDLAVEPGPEVTQPAQPPEPPQLNSEPAITDWFSQFQNSVPTELPQQDSSEKKKN